MHLDCHSHPAHYITSAVEHPAFLHLGLLARAHESNSGSGEAEGGTVVCPNSVVTPLVGPPAVAEYERVGQAVAIDLQREAARGPFSQQPATHLRDGCQWSKIGGTNDFESLVAYSRPLPTLMIMVQKI